VAVLGKTPLVTTLFSNRSIDESFEDVFNPAVNKRMRLLRIHSYHLRGKLYALSSVALMLEHRHFGLNSASGCAAVGNHIACL